MGDDATTPTLLPKELLSLSQVARKCDVTGARASRLVDEGVWVPDFRNGRTLLFLAEHLPHLKAQLANAEAATGAHV